MSFKRRLVLGVAAGFWMMQSSAAPVVVDFEDLGPGTFEGTPGVVSHGFSFNPATGVVRAIYNGADCSFDCASNGTETLTFGGERLAPPAGNPLHMAGTKPFRLLSFDYGEVIGGHSTFNASTLIVIGNVSGGGTLTRTFQLDSNTDGPGGAADFQAATLDAPFSDTLLASVDFYGSSSAVTSGAFSLDNLVTNVTPVPEPGMLSLIGIGLLVFPIARRKPATRQS